MTNTIYTKSGIYKITSLSSSRIYVGQSIDIERRFSDYKKLRHCNEQPKLYNSFIKHGVENHTFEIIEECDISSLNERERFFQEEYDVLSKYGMNCRLTETNDKSGKLSYETIEKIRKANVGKKLSKEHIEKHRISIIGKPIHNKNKIVISNGILNMYVNKESEIPLGFYKGVKESSRKVIQQYTHDYVLIKESTSKTFKEDGFNFSKISECCNGKRKTHKGFNWKYK